MTRITQIFLLEEAWALCNPRHPADENLNIQITHPLRGAEREIGVFV